MLQTDGAELTGDQRSRRREWNREPLARYFPRLTGPALEQLLDLLTDKNITYNTSESEQFNIRRFTRIVVAHVRHNYSDYDKLLANGTERYEARKQTAQQVWLKLREWCPWDKSNNTLERCLKATLLAPHERGADWDPMDIDDDSDYEGDPMDVD